MRMGHEWVELDPLMWTENELRQKLYIGSSKIVPDTTKKIRGLQEC
jgi:hypothetical protein